MSKFLVGLMMLAFLAAPSWSQEDSAAGEPLEEEEAPEPSAPAEAAEEGSGDDADLDTQTYEEDEDDFVPTEEIPADEPIPFPSNI